MNLLIVEDEPILLNNISAYLTQNKFTCENADSFASAWHKISMSDYDCIILDITLPGGNGLELLSQLKKTNKKDGVLIISAKNALDDKIRGLEIGADDYLSKPFHLAELSARINAIIRRKNFDGNNFIQLGNLEINLLHKTVRAGDTLLTLTRKEYELLIYFASNRNRVITKESMIEHLWGENFSDHESYDIIYAHIKNLRRKFTEAGIPDYIRSVYGMGYKFITD